jgi:hypothetical protein
MAMKVWAVVLVGILGIAVPARADSDRYSRPPSTEGPLVAAPLGPTCAEEELMTPTGNGRKGVCEWHFSLAPAAEDDLVNDYVVSWLQIDADPPAGSCIRRIRLSYELEGAEIVSATRSGSTSYKSTRRLEESLSVDAGGEALSAASIFTETLARPGRIDVRVKKDSLRYSWRGRSAKPLSIVLGWQLRVPVTQPIYTVLSTSDVLTGYC